MDDDTVFLAKVGILGGIKSLAVLALLIFGFGLSVKSWAIVIAMLIIYEVARNLMTNTVMGRMPKNRSDFQK